MAEKLQTIGEIRHRLIEMLAVGLPPAEARSLTTAIIAEYTGMGGASQLAFDDRQPGREATERIMEAARRAAAGEPLQYITGKTLFCGHPIRVGPGVLIPRPETEEMTMIIINEEDGLTGEITDLCTGSGCIALALSLALPGAVVTAADNSEAALAAARINISSNGAEVALLKADILHDPPSLLPAADLIVSNPPYVTMSEQPMMRANVLGHEPHEALFVPDSNPLIYYHAIRRIADERLRPGGRLWLEVNESHAGATASLLKREIYGEVKIMEDFRGKRRFVKATKHG